MEEIWKPVTGYESTYHVSNHGRVKSVGRRLGRAGGDLIMVPNKGKYGHGRVQLSRAGNKKRVLVHRLVAIAFIGEPPTEKHEVNHIDYDPTNNHVSNLEWVTHQENIVHSIHRLANPKGEEHHLVKLNEMQIHEIRKQYAEGDISFVKLGKLYGICGQQCHRIVRGQRWSHI